LEVNAVLGNLAVQHAKDVNIRRVSGGFLVQDIGGDLSIHNVAGTLKGTDLYGGVKANRISAGVELFGLHAGADIRASGDIKLTFLTENPAPIILRSSASVYINMPFELNAKMKVKSNAQLTELILGDRKEKISHRKHTVIVGNGRRTMEIDASGRVTVVSEKIEDTEIIKLFEELEMLWAELKKESATRREATEKEFAGEEGADKGVDLTVEELKAAEERVQNAIEQVETRLQSLGYESEANFDGDAEEHSRDITGERLIIMRLLGENKLSIEEADKLLEALD